MVHICTYIVTFDHMQVWVHSCLPNYATPTQEGGTWLIMEEVKGREGGAVGTKRTVERRGTKSGWCKERGGEREIRCRLKD